MILKKVIAISLFFLVLNPFISSATTEKKNYKRMSDEEYLNSSEDPKNIDLSDIFMYINIGPYFQRISFADDVGKISLYGPVVGLDKDYEFNKLWITTTRGHIAYLRQSRNYFNNGRGSDSNRFNFQFLMEQSVKYTLCTGTVICLPFFAVGVGGGRMNVTRPDSNNSKSAGFFRVHASFGSEFVWANHYIPYLFYRYGLYNIDGFSSDRAGSFNFGIHYRF